MIDIVQLIAHHNKRNFLRNTFKSLGRVRWWTWFCKCQCIVYVPYRMSGRRGYKLVWGREREREVAISRTAQEKECGKERDQFQKTEAQEVFKALLVDMVRHINPKAHLSLSRIDLYAYLRWENQIVHGAILKRTWERTIAEIWLIYWTLLRRKTCLEIMSMLWQRRRVCSFINF